MLLIGCTATEPAPQVRGPVSTSPGEAFDTKAPKTPKDSLAPLETSKNTSLIPVYWLGGSHEHTLLYREFRSLPSDNDPITTAVRAMTSHEPLDDDYFTPWEPATTVGTSITSKNVITVDLSSDAFNVDLDRQLAHRAVQQLIYTATAAAAQAGLMPAGEQTRVAILVDGHTGYEAFGQIELGEPMSRDGSLLAPVWIIDPQQGRQIPGPAVKVHGRAVAPDSRLRWRLRRANADADTLKSGTTRIDAPKGKNGTYSFTVKLRPGKYTVTVFRSDSGGAHDAARYPDTKTFTVTGDQSSPKPEPKPKRDQGQDEASGHMAGQHRG